MDDDKWKEWYEAQTDERKLAMGRAAIEYLIYIGSVRFREAEPDEGTEACLYWESCGDDIREGW